jgi:hypothetical protein
VLVALTVLVAILLKEVDCGSNLCIALKGESAGNLMSGASLAAGGKASLSSLGATIIALTGLKTSCFGITELGLISSVLISGTVTGSCAFGAGAGIVGISAGIRFELRLLGRSGTGLGFI